MAVGRLNAGASIMGATIDVADDVRLVWHPDAWHKLRWGWLEPDIVSLRDPASSALLVPANRSGDRPVILYDPRSYDLLTRQGEFFIVEARAREGYDTETRAGTMIWHVRTEARGKLAELNAPGGGKEFAMKYIGFDSGSATAWLNARGMGRLPTRADGPVPLHMYAGRRDSLFRIQLGDSTTTPSGVSWSPVFGRVRPRLDDIRRTSFSGLPALALTGQLPLATRLVAAELRHETTGAVIRLSPAARSLNRNTYYARATCAKRDLSCQTGPIAFTSTRSRGPRATGCAFASRTPR